MAPPPEMTEQERATALEELKKLTFQFATTLADDPHEYVKRTSENEELYVRLWENWKKFGVWGTWDGPKGPRRYKYWYPGDGFRYWAMSTTIHPVESRWASKIINRTRIEGAQVYYAEEVKQAKESGIYKAHKAREAAREAEAKAK